MYQVIDGCRFDDQTPRIFPGVFLLGEEGIPLQGHRVVNRFTNFPDDQLLIWLMQHENRQMERLDGVTLPLYGDWSGNFWHWCYQTLPLALSAHRSGFSGSYLVPAVPFAAQSLELIGIPPERIVVAGAADYYLECMCLIRKLPGAAPANLEALLEVRELFRARFADPGREHRIYVSRNGSPDALRRIVNEAQLEALLEAYGFVTLHLEKLPFAEQLSYLCNCSALVGPHGAGMTHLSFMPEGSLVVEHFAPSYVNPCLLPACRRLGHRYVQVTSSATYDGYPYGLDIEANLNILEITLDHHLGCRPARAGSV